MTQYRNPILDADWSDPDAIRVGDDYYMTASTFSRVPGLPILHSRNLVDWRLIGHALPKLVPEAHYALPRHGSGVWAPAIRHHDGLFYIFYPDPDHGIYVVTAEDPAGPWSEPNLIYAGRGIIDPCPFWDEDGRAYLAHAWAKTRAGFWNRITMHEMAPDASRLIGPGRTLIEGEDIPGFIVLEGPKLHRRDGWYWVFAPAGTVPVGWQSVFRSRNIWGPYEERTVLAQGSSPVNGPHQGAWVDAADGSDWFLHFQDRGPYGRVVHLQPMSWDEDGWPRMGNNWDGSRGTGVGEPVLDHPMPHGEPTPEPANWREDLPPGWYWQANPAEGWVRDSGPGRFELAAVPDDTVNLREIPHVLSQRLPGGPSEFTVRLELVGDTVDSRAGIVMLGRSYGWIGLRRRPGGVLAVEAATGGEARVEKVLSSTVVAPDAVVELRVRSDRSANATFAWRHGDEEWREIAPSFPIAPGFWTGADLGIFATSSIGTEAPPVARFSELHLTALEPGDDS